MCVCTGARGCGTCGCTCVRVHVAVARVHVMRNLCAPVVCVSLSFEFCDSVLSEIGLPREGRLRLGPVHVGLGVWPGLPPPG